MAFHTFFPAVLRELAHGLCLPGCWEEYVCILLPVCGWGLGSKSISLGWPQCHPCLPNLNLYNLGSVWQVWMLHVQAALRFHPDRLPSHVTHHLSAQCKTTFRQEIEEQISPNSIKKTSQPSKQTVQSFSAHHLHRSWRMCLIHAVIQMEVRVSRRLIYICTEGRI